MPSTRRDRQLVTVIPKLRELCMIRTLSVVRNYSPPSYNEDVDAKTKESSPIITAEVGRERPQPHKDGWSCTPLAELPMSRGSSIKVLA